MSTERTIDGYTKAWTAADYETTRSYLADDLDFQGSLEQHTSADGFMGGLKMFRDGLYESHQPIHSVVSGDEGFVLYDCGLKTGATLRCAEYFRVEGGKIKEIRLTFDTSKVPAPPSQ